MNISFFLNNLQALPSIYYLNHCMDFSKSVQKKTISSVHFRPLQLEKLLKQAGKELVIILTTDGTNSAGLII